MWYHIAWERLGALPRFCASAGTAQWAALHHLMEYLSNQSSFKITCRRGMKLVDLLSGFADADWGNSSSRRSTSGMVMLYNKSPIMWKSKMQKTTAHQQSSSSTYGTSVLKRGWVATAINSSHVGP